MTKPSLILKKKNLNTTQPLSLKQISKKESGSDLTLTVKQPKNVQFVEEHSPHIFKHLLAIEVGEDVMKGVFLPNEDCVRRQKDINMKMMDILFEWMAEVCLKFKFQTETFFLAVNLVHRYLSAHQCPREKLQLLGLTSLFMSGKYEEIYPPPMKEYLYLCENVYLKTEMIAMEAKILGSTDFRIATPTPLKFLHRYSHLAGFTKKEQYFSCFILELTAVSSRIALSYKGSLQAAACVYLTNKVFSKSPDWPPKLAEGTGLRLSEVQPCAKEVFLLLFRLFGQSSECSGGEIAHSFEDCNFNAIRRKYSTSEYYDVARIRFEWKSNLQQA
jgi:hypothetical protein